MRKTMKVPADPGSLSREELIKLVRQLVELVQAQQAELEEHRRAAKRQAAPFSKGRKKGEHRRPGRRPGEGPFAFREPPSPESVTDFVDVPPPSGCPDCGGELELDHFEDAYTTDLPEPKPKVTRFRSAVCRCKKCGCGDVRGRHPDLAPDQRGVTAHRVGPAAMAAAHAMHYGYGVTVRKTVPILKELAGIQVTQSAITQDALRRAEREPLKTKYQALRDSVRKSPVAQTDDTGWRKNGKPAQLMVFATPDTPLEPGVTVYQVRDQHRNEEVREVIPADYGGTMVTDRGRAYDAKELNDVKQQKCIFHVGRSIDAVLETKTGAARDFGELLIQYLGDALSAWHDYHAGRRAGYDGRSARIDQTVTFLLRPRQLTDADNQRLLDELGRHQARGNLLRFLKDPNIPPTNNLSEQELRLAVQARKVSHCSKNDRGAAAHESHSSVIRTELRKKPGSLVDGVRRIYIGATPQAPQPP